MKSVGKNRQALSLLALCLIATPVNVNANGRSSIDDNKTNVAGVLLGPCGLPGAVGPTGTDDDFSNRSINNGVVPPGSVTTAADAIVFRNTAQNVGTGDDIFIISVPSAPPAFKIEISTDFGEHYLTLESRNHTVAIPVSYRASATFLVRVTAPPGLKTLTGFDTVIRATSMMNPAVTNDTINRLYTGFIRVDETATIVKGAGAGSAGEMVPGAEIEVTITYTNISSAEGDGSSLLTARNIVIHGNSCTAANSWAANTEHVVGASDNQGGHIIGDRAGSTSLTDIVATLEAGQSGIFKFRRRIK